MLAPICQLHVTNHDIFHTKFISSPPYCVLDFKSSCNLFYSCGRKSLFRVHHALNIETVAINFSVFSIFLHSNQGIVDNDTCVPNTDDFFDLPTLVFPTKYAEMALQVNEKTFDVLFGETPGGFNRKFLTQVKHLVSVLQRWDNVGRSRRLESNNVVAVY